MYNEFNRKLIDKGIIRIKSMVHGIMYQSVVNS